MVRRCALFDEDGEDGMCLLEEGHDGVCLTATQIEDEWPDVDEDPCGETFTSAGGALLRCTMPRGHGRLHARVEPVHQECPGFVHDRHGNRAHCIRPEGHTGPHAAGWSLDSPETCGETERGTGRVCLRQPHPHWPDAHDFGAGHEDMTTPPDWWEPKWGDWPGGPVGAIPNQPFF